MSKEPGAAFLDRFVDLLRQVLDELGEEGHKELIELWNDEYEKVFREQVANFVENLVMKTSLNHRELAERLGARSKSFICEIRKGRISLHKLQRLVDYYETEIRFPPRSTRYVPATIRAMKYVLSRDGITDELTEEGYEYVRLASRLKPWWRARDDGDSQAIHDVTVELMEQVRTTIPAPRIREITELTELVDKWVVAYLVCLSIVSEYGVD